MYNLNKTSCFNEVVSYCHLCNELGVKTVYLEADTFNRIKQVLDPIVGKYSNFIGVKFKAKK